MEVKKNIYKKTITLYIEFLVKYTHFFICFDEMYSPEKKQDRQTK